MEKLLHLPYFVRRLNVHSILTKILVVFVALLSQHILAQELHHQMISSQGISLKTSKDLYVHQTIGQLSIVGQSPNKNFIVFQGFQQGVWSTYMIDIINDTKDVAIYPNPFSNFLNFSFSEVVLDPITITIYDINGKVVYLTTKRTAQKLLFLDLPQLSEAVYMVKLTASKFRFNAKIIKKE